MGIHDNSPSPDPKGPLPYFKWFVKDWRSSRKVQRMGYVARGLYRELLDEQWLRGFIPSGVEQLAEIADCPEEVMALEWPKISGLFEELSPGKLANQKLEEMRTAVDSYRVRQAQFGRQGGRPKNDSIPNFRSKSEGLEKGSLTQLNPTLNEPKGNASQKRRGEAEEKKRTLVPVGTVAPLLRHEDFVSAWNDTCGSLPKVRDLTDGRRKKIRARISQNLTIERFTEAARKCAQTRFLTGENERGWHADFDWLVGNDTNIVKVLEGKYDLAKPVDRCNFDGLPRVGAREPISAVQSTVSMHAEEFDREHESDAGFRDWKNVLALLETKLLKQSFDTWLKPTRYSFAQGSTMFVRIPSDEFRYIGSKYHNEILAAVRELNLPFSEVNFITPDETAEAYKCSVEDMR